MRVMGVVKPGLGCDDDRRHERVNEHRMLRRFLGHASVSCEDPYPLQRVMDNVERLAGVGRRVVESGHKVAGKSLARRGSACPLPASLERDAMTRAPEFLPDAAHQTWENGRFGAGLRGIPLRRLLPSACQQLNPGVFWQTLIP